MNILSSLTFWTLVAGMVAFVAKFLAPGFPFTAEQILAALVFLLGLVNIKPTMQRLALEVGDILHVKAFWVMIVGIVGFVVRYYFPTFPLDDVTILAIVIFVLGLFQINPELRGRGM